MFTDVRGGRLTRLSLVVLTLGVLAVLPAPAAAAPAWLAPADVGSADHRARLDGDRRGRDRAGRRTRTSLREACCASRSARRAARVVRPGRSDARDHRPLRGRADIRIDDAERRPRCGSTTTRTGSGTTHDLPVGATAAGRAVGAIEAVSASAVSPDASTGRISRSRRAAPLTAVWQFTDYGSGYRVVSARRSVQGAWEAPTD